MTRVPESLQEPFRSALVAAAEAWIESREHLTSIRDRHGFFEVVLTGVRARACASCSRRVHLPDGSWYWDLVPDFRWGDVVEI